VSERLVSDCLMLDLNAAAAFLNLCAARPMLAEDMVADAWLCLLCKNL
jgi:hypothetical protein